MQQPVTNRRNRTTWIGAAVLAATSTLVMTSSSATQAAPPVPTTTVSASTNAPLVGEDVALTVTFDNTDTTDAGFGPYIDLVFDSGGADGDDGVSFGSAAYLGSPLAPLEVFDCTGASVEHPLTGISTPCPAGSQLVVLQLPFGSFTPGQPVAPIDVLASVSDLADVGAPLDVTATGGFAFGDSPTGTTPITGTTASSTLEPEVIRFTKRNVDPEEETATGPNYPRSYILEVDIADGQTVNDLTITDRLPGSYVYLSSASTLAGAPVAEPAVGVVVDPGANLLEYLSATPVVGTSAAVDASLTFEYYISDVDFVGVPIIDASSGDDVETVNDGQASGTVVPLDPRDDPAPFVLNTPDVDPDNDDDARIEAKSIAIQKTASISPDIGAPGLTPGDGVEYTISGQVSDYFTFDDVTVEDVLGDGQTFDTAFVPTLTITEGGVSTPVSLVTFFAVDESQRTTCGNGSTTIDFDVSNADAAATGNGILTGGGVLVPAAGATTFEIIFRATVNDEYACSFTGTGPLNPNDFIVNDVTVTGEVLDNDTQASQAIPQFESDGSGTRLDVTPTTIAKSIWARNGAVVPAAPTTPLQFAGGDTITYRLSLLIPSSDFDSLVLADYLPLPTLTATALTPEASACTATTAPALNSWCYGPDDTMSAAPGFVDPTTSFDTSANSVSWDFGTQEIADNALREIELLFTLEISDAAFRDGLFLTNQVQADEENSFEEPFTSAAIVQIELTAPALNIGKGVVARTANPGSGSSGTLAPTGVTFDGVTTATPCADFSGTASSTSLANGGPDANATGLDAGDVVRFAVVVENTGNGLNGAFDVAISDTVPAGFEIPAGGLDLCVTDGAGNALANTATGFFTGTPSASPLGAGSITLTDGATGALAPFDDTSGANVAVITYNLQLVAAVGANTPAASLTNTAAITDYSGTEGGPSYLPVTPEEDLTDPASVTTKPLTVDKALTDTSQASTSGRNVAIGEEAEYTVTVTVPEGVSRDVRLVDSLPNGLVISRPPTAAVIGGNLAASAVAAPTISTNGRVLTFEFGDITNSGTDNVVDAGDQITFTYWAVVTNISANQNGQNRRNSAAISYLRDATGTARSTHRDSTRVRIVEPTLQVGKSASVPTVDAGDTFTYTLLVNHRTLAPASSADAFEVALTDSIPAGLTFAGNLASSGTAPTTLTETAGVIDATWTLFPFGSSSEISFDVTVDGAFNPVAPFTNTGDLTYTGLPGSPTTPLGGGEERTGTGDVNDYATSADAIVRPISPAIDKILVETDQATTADPNVTIGEIITYDLAVTLPEGSFDGFVVTDVVPAGLQYVPGSGEVFTSNGAASPSPGLAADFDGTLPTAAISGGATDGDDVVFTFGAATVNPDDPADDTDNTIVLRIDARVLDVPGNVGVTPGQNTLNNTSTVQIDGGAVVNSGVVATPVVEPRLAIQKSFDPTTASQGDTITVLYSVTNTGLSTAHDVIIDDTLDTPFNEATALEGVTPAGFVYSQSGSTLTYTGGDIAPGATLVFAFTVDLDNPLPAGTLVMNTATVTQHTTLPGAVPGERDEPDVSGSTQLNTVGPDLTLTKDDGITQVTPGQQTTYDLVITNVGGFQATGVTISDTLPAGTTFVGIAGADCTDGGETSPGVRLINVAGAIAADGGTTTCQITIQITDPAPAGTGGYLNNAVVADDGTNGPDPTPDNNTAQDNDTITGLAPDLVVVKDDSTPQLVPGQTTTYVVTVTNIGNVGVTHALVTDTLPPGLTFAGCTSIAGTVDIACAANGPIVTITYAEIAGDGGSASFEIEATVDEPVVAGNETVTNTVTVTDDGANGPDADPSNNDDTDIDTIVALPDMTIAKSHAEDAVEPGGVVTYRLDVSNAGRQNAAGVIVTDTVDPQMTIDCASALPVPTACDAGTGVITWGPGLQDSAGATIGEFTAGLATVLTYETTADNPLLAGTTEFLNTATVADDGASGADPTRTNNTALDTVPLTGNLPDLNIVKDDGIDTLVPGQAFAYDLTITNVGNIGVTGVAVTDVLPAGLEFVGCSNSCDSSALPTVSWLLPGALAGNGGQIILTLDVQVTDPAAAGIESLTNTASVTDDGTNGVDPTPDDNSDDDTDALAAVPELAVTKDDGATERDAGETFDYTIVVSNTGDQAATGVVVTDTLPEILAAGSCPATPTPCTIDADAGTVTWNVGTLEGGADQIPAIAGSSTTLTVTVTVDAAIASGATEFTNTVRAVDDGTNTGGVPVEATDTDTDTVVATPDLQITKSDSVTTAQPGDTLTYAVVVTNVGTQAATGVTVTDTLPTGVTFVSCTLGCDSSTLPTLTWTDVVETVPGMPVDAAAFDAGGQATLTVVVTVDEPAASGLESLTNTVTVTDDGTNGADPTPDNNTAEDIDVLDAAPDLQITKSDGVASVTDGQNVTYDIEFSNIGDQAAIDVTITDTIATETSFVSCSDGCDSSAAPVITWAVGDLAPGAGGTYTLTVAVADPVPAGTRTIVNNVAIADDGTNGPDSDPTNDTDDDTDTYGIDLGVTKTDGQTTAVPGEALTYTVTVVNNGPTTIDEFTLVETLPEALMGVTFDTSTGTYDPATGSWTGFGDFAEGDTLTLTVAGIIDPTATGTLVNTVAVSPPDGVPDTDPSNDTDTDTDTLEPTSNLVISKELVSETVVRGEDAVFNISIRNTGPSTAVGVVVTDPLSGVLTYVGASGENWTCDESANTVACELDIALTVGSTASLNVVATVTGEEGSTFSNTATVELPTAVLGIENDPTDTAIGEVPMPSNPDMGEPLPQTGGGIFRTLMIGLLLVLGGAALAIGFRRRHQSELPA